MATGPIILSLFAAIWAIAGALLLGGLVWVSILALLLSAAIVVSAVRLARALPPRSEAEDRRIGRLVGAWSAAEGIAIFLGIGVVTNLGHPELNAAVMCLAVGLHFFPLARGLPRKSLYVSGTILTALGLGGLLFGGSIPAVAIDLIAAAGLWLSALLGLGDMRRAIIHYTKL